MKPINVRPEAKLDILEAVLWYENEQEGLGWKFDDEIDGMLSRIQERPQQFPTIELDVRRALLDRFPYAIYFADNELALTVLAVYHLHRHPDSWKHRRGQGSSSPTGR